MGHLPGHPPGHPPGNLPGHLQGHIPGQLLCHLPGHLHGPLPGHRQGHLQGHFKVIFNKVSTVLLKFIRIVNSWYIFLTNSIRGKAFSIRTMPLTVNRGKKRLFFTLYRRFFTHHIAFLFSKNL